MFIQQIHLFWLGRPYVQINGLAIKLETNKVLALLAYLSLSEEKCSREFLATLFWPEFDQQHAYGNLRRALSSLHKSINLNFLDISRDSLGAFDPTFLWLDVQEFHRLMMAVKDHAHPENETCPACLSALEKAARLYRGEFMAGFNLRDCSEFDSWQLFQRDLCRQEFSSALEKLSGIYARLGSWPQAIDYARRWAALDPLHEAAQIALVRLYNQSGQRNSAIRQYEEYAHTLKKELDLSPEVDLHQLLISNRPDRSSKVNQSEALPKISPVVDPILKTKLFIPPSRAGVYRKHLVNILETGTKCRLALISAPAGFGKTMLLSEWAGKCQDLISWFSLDKGDNDPHRFLRHLLAGIDLAFERNPKIRQSRESEQVRAALSQIEQAIQEQQLPPNSILGNITNCLIDLSRPIILILDDYQFIDNQAIHEAVSFLLEHSPAGVRLVIATRSDPPLPLARLRARGQMVELRADDLRFTASEAAQFLNDVMGLGLDDRSVTVLEERTEGWIAGLQMAAITLQAGLSSQGHKDVSAFIAGFSGTNRYILDYLLEEVLASQPPEIQRFLLYTSILERLTGPLCDAVMASDGGSKMEGEDRLTHSEPRFPRPAASSLEYLERANLFLVPLDDERQWYRYHHLFADLLHARLDQLYPGLSRRLHGHAADWYEHEGMTVEAINHALAAGEYDRAARLVEKNTTRLLAKGELNAMMTWIEVLPKELRLARPWLCIHQAYVLVMSGRLAEVPPLLAQAEVMLDAANRPGEEAETSFPPLLGTESLSSVEGRSLAGAIAAIRAVAAATSDQANEAISLARQARELLPAENLWDRTAAGWALGYSLHMQGRLPEARSAFEEQVRLGRAMSNTATVMIGLADLSWVLRDQGKIRQARALLEGALTEASQKDARTLGFVARTEATLAGMLYEQNELEAAHRLLSDALTLARFWPNPNHLPFTHAFLARVLLAEGDLQGAWSSIGEACKEGRSAALTRLIRRLVEADLIRVWLAFQALGIPIKVGDPLVDQAEALVTAWENELASSTESAAALTDDVSETAALTLARVVLAAGRAEEALSLLERLTQSARAAGHTKTVIGSLVLSAIARQACLALQDQSARWARSAEQGVSALEDLEEVLGLAEAGGYVRIFLDEGRPMQMLLAQWLARAGANPLRGYAIRLLSQFDAELQAVAATPEIASPNDDLVEPLSPRELEVLHLLVLGKTNPEISRQLVVSPGTVKAHTASIYRKLDVANRTEAVAHARQLGILP